MRRATHIVLLGVSLSAMLLARDRKIAQIDEYCDRMQSELSNATPFLFEGPEPWVEIDQSEADEGDVPAAYAYVYTIGPQIRRVFIRVTNEDDGWREDILYFYSPAGDLLKRIRVVQCPGANITLETVSYYRDRQLLKQISHHHGMTHGKRDSSRFLDPGAPVFWTTDDLPFSDLVDVWRGLI